MRISALRPAFLYLCLLAGLLAAPLATAPLAATESAAVAGHWQGEIALPGTALKFDVDLTSSADGTLAGDISIPAQGAVDLPLVDVELEGDELRFRIAGIPGEPSFAGTPNEDGSVISGSFSQSGGGTTFSMTRGDSPAVAAAAAIDGLETFLTNAIEAWNVAGTAVAVVAGGEVIFARGFGQRDRERGLPVTADTLFAIGSTTKAFTATTLGTLVDEGKLDWDRPLRTYMPEFRLSDSNVSERISPRDLVTHRSGLPRHDLLWYNFNEGTRADLVARLADLELSADLRERFQYNNLMFLTAGHLAERLTGQSWEGAVRARILAPLGMTRTNFSVLDSQKDGDHALPYRESDEGELEAIPFRVADLVGPAGSINSSVHEMSRWVQLNLSHGQVGETRVIEAATLADIHAPHMVTETPAIRPDISSRTYALGWAVDTYRGHRRVAHGGAIDGFTAEVMLFPDDGLGIVALSNSSTGLTSLIGQHVADRVLGLDFIAWSGDALTGKKQGEEATREAKTRKTEDRKEGTRPSHPLADYAGDYHHPSYGPLTVKLDGERLTVTFNHIETPLDHWHYEVFAGAETDGDPTFEDVKFQFRGDVHGNVATVESAFEPTVAPIEFAKQPDHRLSDPAYLQRFTGRYSLSGQPVEITLSGNRLVLAIAGQPPYTLEPEVSGRFVLANFSLITVDFEQDDAGNVIAATVYQPEGVYRAERIQ